jgi:hypothetical protein
MRSGSSAHVARQELKGKFMKKAKKNSDNGMRAEYKRSDFKKLERGKFYKQVTTKSNVVILQPQIAEAFPNSEIVNETLSNLLTLAKRSSRAKPRAKQPRGKVARSG